MLRKMLILIIMSVGFFRAVSAEGEKPCGLWFTVEEQARICIQEHWLGKYTSSGDSEADMEAFLIKSEMAADSIRSVEGEMIMAWFGYEDSTYLQVFKQDYPKGKNAEEAISDFELNGLQFELDQRHDMPFGHAFVEASDIGKLFVIRPIEDIDALYITVATAPMDVWESAAGNRLHINTESIHLIDTSTKVCQSHSVDENATICVPKGWRYWSAGQDSQEQLNETMSGLQIGDKELYDPELELIATSFAPERIDGALAYIQVFRFEYPEDKTPQEVADEMTLTANQDGTEVELDFRLLDIPSSILGYTILEEGQNNDTWLLSKVFPSEKFGTVYVSVVHAPSSVWNDTLGAILYRRGLSINIKD